MNASSPSAVVAGSCLSSSAPTSAGRQACFTNAGFFSAFLPSSPCRCALSLYPAVGKSSFFYLPPGRRERSAKTVLVVKGSSTFEPHEERVQRLQVAERARARVEPVVTGQVAWSADGKPTILWPSTKEPGKGVSQNEERRSSAERRNKDEAELTGQAGAQDARHATSEGEHGHFFAPKNRQSTARLPEHIPIRPSTPPPRQRTEIFDSSPAPRLPIGAPAFKRAVEADTLGAPPYPIQRGASSVDRNAPNQFESVPLRREDSNEVGLVFTSKLEEILNDFRNRQQREERWRDKKNRRGNPDDGFQEAGLSSRGSSSHGSSRESTSNNSLSWKSSGRDHQSATYGRPNHANPSDESSDAIEEHGKVFHGKGIFASRPQNHAHEETADPEPLDLPNSPSATPWKSRRGRSSVFDLESSIRNRGSASAEGQAATYGRMQSNSSSSYSKSKGKIWTNDKRGLLAREKGTERPHDESSDAIEEHGNVFHGKGIFASRPQNHAHKETDPEPLDLPNSPLATPSKSRGGRSPVSDLESSIRNRGSASAEGQAATYGRMQSISSSSFSKSKGKFWTNDKRGLFAREKGTERPHDESSDAIEEHGKVFRGKGSFASRPQNHAHKEMDPEPLDPPNSPLATPWKSRRGRSPVSDLESSIRNRDSASAEGQAVTYGRMQSNSSSSYSKSKGKFWTNDKRGLLARKKGIERPHDSDRNQDPQFHTSRGHGDNLDEDGSVGTALHTESESADDSLRPVQSKELTASLITVKKEPLIKDNKATWHSQPNSSLPFEYQFSYSEAPSAPIIRYREKPYSPFGPQTMSRPWTGGPPLKKSKKNLPMFDSFNPPPKGKKGVKHVQDPGPYPPGQGPKAARSRDEIHGEPLTNEEIAILIDNCQAEKRQLNLGRDGLTHNMLDLVHCHWKRRRVIRIRCLGVPTVDMDNVCFHLEDKTGGKVIYHSGGIVYLFRGRNYNYKDRPEIPLMLWKPITPVYPKLITRAPGGLTEEEADQLRELGKKVEPLCRLSKNGIYYKLVENVRVAFTLDKLVRIDCQGLNPSDYKKIGAKLKDLVPCVLLSFDNEQILMWKGEETSTDPESSKASVAEAFSEESSVVDTGLPSPRDLEEYDTDLTGAFHDISHSKLLKDYISPEVSMETKLSASSEVSVSKALAAQSEQDLDEPNLLFQNSWAHRENDMAPSGMMSNAKRLPEDTLVETGSYNKLAFWTEGRERETASQAVVGLQSSLITLDNVESVVAAEDSADNCSAVRFDDLWDQAITSGSAVQLDDGEMDNDNVVTRARKLAGEVPAGEDYTRKLIKSLQIRAPRLSQPNQDLHKHLRRIKRMKLEKKLGNRRSFRNQGAELQAFRQDGHGSNGMNVDELAQLLSMR